MVATMVMGGNTQVMQKRLVATLHGGLSAVNSGGAGHGDDN